MFGFFTKGEVPDFLKTPTNFRLRASIHYKKGSHTDFPIEDLDQIDVLPNQVDRVELKRFEHGGKHFTVVTLHCDGADI